MTQMQQACEGMEMPQTGTPAWLYGEFRHSGVDYADNGIAARYDENHQRFRDFEKEAEGILARLKIGRHQSVLDFGCGTGAFVLTAARKCRKVHAVDVSSAMLDRCREKATSLGLTNIEFHQAGFLTHVHQDEPVDGIVSVAALHHLPDFWKAVALQRMYGMLKPGGRLFLFDIVFPALAEGYEVGISGWLNGIREKAGERMAGEAVVHIRDEHSTFDWVLEGMLERAGFCVKEKDSAPGFSMTYICER